jgi:hypothetical protein
LGVRAPPLLPLSKEAAGIVKDKCGPKGLREKGKSADGKSGEVCSGSA